MSELLENEIAAQRHRWESDQGTDAAWDARRLVTELSKSGQSDLAIEHGELALEVFKAFEPLASAVAWAFYRRDLTGITEESDLAARRRAKHAVERIKQLTASNPYDTYSPWSRAALKFASILSKRWPQQALGILSQLDADQLSDQREGDFSPERERWFMQYTKALESAELWPDLLEASDKALVEPCIEQKYKRWIRLRHAQALRYLGRSQEALSIIQQEAKASGDWWLFARLAKIFFEEGQQKEALHYAYRALLAGGASSYGWETLALVAGLLKHDDPVLAADHARLSKMFREKEGWPESASLEDLAEQLGVEESEQSNIGQLLRQLKKTWQQAEDVGRETGTVIKRLNDGAGFIQPDSGGGSLFFSLPRDSNEKIPEVGKRVSYLKQKSFDKSKNMESERAFKWQEIE